ncbi:hypothetical protein NIES2130_17300 [Scytonema sp. HK-05]|nr:hypothetical protein NIES2130_17300 [Scytonema sp. HK-05]
MKAAIDAFTPESKNGTMKWSVQDIKTYPWTGGKYTAKRLFGDITTHLVCKRAVACESEKSGY